MRGLVGCVVLSMVVAEFGMAQLDPQTIGERFDDFMNAQGIDETASQSPGTTIDTESPGSGIDVSQWEDGVGSSASGARSRLSSDDLPDAPPDGSGEAVEELYAQVLMRNYDHYLWIKDQQQESFDWHLRTSKVIFYVVVGLVVFGVALAGVQFTFALIRKKKQDSTDLELTGKGFRIKSSIVGVIILMISLLFYYLFLVHVYPVTLVGI
jgi:hypothetical protein